MNPDMDNLVGSEEHMERQTYVIPALRLPPGQAGKAFFFEKRSKKLLLPAGCNASIDPMAGGCCKCEGTQKFFGRFCKNGLLAFYASAVSLAGYHRRQNADASHVFRPRSPAWVGLANRNGRRAVWHALKQSERLAIVRGDGVHAMMARLVCSAVAACQLVHHRVARDPVHQTEDGALPGGAPAPDPDHTAPPVCSAAQTPDACSSKTSPAEAFFAAWPPPAGLVFTRFRVESALLFFKKGLLPCP